MNPGACIFLTRLTARGRARWHGPVTAVTLTGCRRPAIHDSSGPCGSSVHPEARQFGPVSKLSNSIHLYAAALRAKVGPVRKCAYASVSPAQQGIEQIAASHSFTPPFTTMNIDDITPFPREHRKAPVGMELICLLLVGSITYSLNNRISKPP